MPAQTETTRLDMKLEVVPIPVSDVDAAKIFYTENVGFNLDQDIRPIAAFLRAPRESRGLRPGRPYSCRFSC
jgi:hypothetical protein